MFGPSRHCVPRPNRVAFVNASGETDATPSRHHAGNLAQADRIHQEYGFSQFDLHTASGSYRTGRLGARLFRATDAAVLSDPCVPHALQMLDPHRSLLCIDTKDRLCDVLPPGASVLARSFRMSNDVDHLLERLSGFRRF